MDKFESKAKEILAEVENILDKKSHGEDLRQNPYGFYDAANEGFLEILMKVQTLFYLYDPTMPLYLRSLRLGDSLDNGYSDHHFEDIKVLLQVFLEMLEFQGA